MNISDLKKLAFTESNWLNVAQAAKELEVTTTQLHSGRASGTIPGWMQKSGRYWLIDVNSDELSNFLGGKVKKSHQAKKGHIKKGNNVSVFDVDIDELTKRSTIADLEISLHKSELERYKVSKAKLDLEIRSGDIVSRQLAEFLYLGYMDRINRETLQSPRKLEAKIEQLIVNIITTAKSDIDKDPDPKETARQIGSMFSREVGEVIRVVKDSQKKSLQRWAEEEGVKIDWKNE